LNFSELLVGDIVILMNGMELPTDGILIEGLDISTDESAMTGLVFNFRRICTFKKVNFCLVLKIKRLIKKYELRHRLSIFIIWH